MVVGNGLLANAFKEFKEVESVVIFGSGVSNSSEQRSSEFLREENLIKKYISQDKLFVYFSTCSVHDESLKGSSYIQHKLKMEKLIQEKFSKYFVVRLPNVVGSCKNPNTLMNYFYNQINSEKEITVQKKSSRYLVHIDEVKSIVSSVIKSEIKLNLMADLVIHEKVTIIEIVQALEKFVKKKAIVHLSEKGHEYIVEVHPLFKPYLTSIEQDKQMVLHNLIAHTYGNKEQI